MALEDAIISVIVNEISKKILKNKSLLVKLRKLLKNAKPVRGVSNAH